VVHWIYNSKWGINAHSNLTVQHFDTPPESILQNCNLWWFWIGMVFGFGLWSSCILFRVLRLYIIFIKGKPFEYHWALILMVLDCPFILYTFLLSSNEAVLYMQQIRACLYISKWWIVLDFGLVSSYFGVVMYLVWSLKNVKDTFGENESIRRAIFVALSLWSLTIIVYLLGIDSQWYGRSICTASVAISVALFFLIQNIEGIEQTVVQDQATQEHLTTAAVLARDPDEESYDGEEEFLYLDSGKKLNTNLKQRMFSQAVLGKNH